MALTTTDGSKSLYAYLVETTPGTRATGAYRTLRSKVGVKFDFKRETIMSKERRADRMESGLTYGNKSGSLSIPIEWSYGSYDDLMEMVMGSTWAANVLKIGNTAHAFSAEETSSELGIVEAYLGNQLGSFSISQKVNGIAEGDFSGIYLDCKVAQTKGVNLVYNSVAKTITRSTAGFLTVDGFVNGDSITARGNTDAGNNNTVPWVITTLTDTVMTFTTADGMVSKATPAAGVTLNLGTAATSLVAAATTTPFDSFTGTITEGGAVIAHVTGWDLKVENAQQANFALGSDLAQSVSTGTCKVSGNLTVYYTDQALRKKFINGVGSTLSLVLGSVEATKAYTFSCGTVKYTSNSRDDAEMARTESLSFVATYNTGDASTLKITRTP